MLIGADQHGIKPIGTLKGQKVVIGDSTVPPQFCSDCLGEEGVRCIIGERMVSLRKGKSQQEEKCSLSNLTVGNTQLT